MNKIAAKHAVGIFATKNPRPNNTAINVRPWTIEARGVLPPNLIFATVRIVAVAVVTPPSKPAAMLAIPWPNVSLSLLCLFPVILSATLQLNKLSRTAKAAKANAGLRNEIVRLKSGIYIENI